MTDATGKTIETWVYAGAVETSDGKRGARFKLVMDGLRLGDERVFDYAPLAKKAKVVLFIGGVYTVEVTNGGRTAYLGTMKQIDTWDNRDDRLRWDGKSRAVLATMAAKRKAKDEAARNIIREVMEPLRDMYAATNYENRTALEIIVLQALRGKKL